MRTTASATRSPRIKRNAPAWSLVILFCFMAVGVNSAASAKHKSASPRSQRGKAVLGTLGPVGRGVPPPTLRSTAAGDPFKYATAFGPSRASLGDRSTGSAVVRMENGDSWIQFALIGSAGSSAKLSRGKLVFVQPDKRRAVYERIDAGIKEDIVLPSRPASPLIPFRFRHSGLEMTARRDGYHFSASGKDEDLFRVKNPSVVDANGKRGGATLSISGSLAVIRIDDKFLDEAKYPIVVDPTIVATASQASPAGLSIDRHIVRSTAGTLVFFYQSGVGLEYKTSTDNGVTWSSATAVSPTTYNEFCVFMSAANDIYVAYRGNGSTDAIFFRKLTYSAGTWTTGAERTVESGGQSRRYPSIVRESSGLIWVTWLHRVGGYSIRVRSSNNEGTTWSGSTSLGATNSYGSPIAVIYQTRGAVVYEVNDTRLDWRRWSGAAWGAAQTIVSGDDYDDANWGSLTTTSDGNLHMVHAPQGGGWIRYAYYNGSSWSSLFALTTAAGDRYPSISTDGTRLWVFWSQYVGENQYRIVYRKYSGGSWDTGPKQLTGSDEDTFAKALTYSSATVVSYSESLTATEFLGAGAAQGWRADDQSWSYTLPFDFPFYDTTRTSVWVCSNGFLDFTSNNTDYTNSTAEMAARVMICGLWDDIRTDLSGQPGEDIYIYQPDAGSVVFRWVAERYSTGEPINFEIRLYDDGRIKFNYGSGNTNLSPTIGVSDGSGSNYELSTYDGAAILTDAQTSSWTRNPPSNWLDVTTEAASTSTGDVNLFNANGDALYAGSAVKFGYVYFDLQTPASASVVPSWEYWDGASWQPLTLSENPGYAFTGSGRVAFTPPADWQTRSLNGSSSLYYVRIARTAPVLATPPVADQFTSVRNNIQPTSASMDTSSIPVGWSEGVTSPYTVRFAAVPLVDITLSIIGTYDRSGTFHGSPPFGVDFGDMDPVGSPYVVGAGAGVYAAALRVTSDSTWDLTVQADGDLRDGLGNTAPISNLAWAFDGSGTWTPFVNAPTVGPILTGQAANFPAGTMVYFDYQYNVDWMTTPSSAPYGTTLMYSAVQGS